MDDDFEATAAGIIAAQLADGAIPSGPGSRLDPWNQAEAAMGLDAAGRHSAAVRAYAWLANTQNPDGSWYAGYRASRPLDRAEDTTGSAHVVVGALHHYLCTDDNTFLTSFWPTIDRALTFTLAVQRPTGEMSSLREPSGATSELALLAGNCDIHHAIRCGLTLASVLGHSRPQWMVAARSLRHVIVQHSEVFVPKPHAADWYYPALTGVLYDADAHRRINRGWHRFVGPNNEIRRTPEKTSTTRDETAELALTLAVLGDNTRSTDLLNGFRRLRHRDASYWTGHNYETGHFWPPQRPTRTVAVALLAAAAVAGHQPTLRTFRTRTTC